MAPAVAQGLLEGGKVRCDWPDAADTLPPEWQRLACNMLVLAAELLPRGGVVTIAPRGSAGAEVTAEGETVTVAPELQTALGDGAGVDGLTPRTVHAFYTARLAQHLGARLGLVLEHGTRAVLSAETR